MSGSNTKVSHLETLVDKLSQNDKIEDVVDKLRGLVGGMLESVIKHIDFPYTKEHILSKK